VLATVDELHAKTGLELGTEDALDTAEQDGDLLPGGIPGGSVTALDKEADLLLGNDQHNSSQQDTDLEKDGVGAIEYEVPTDLGQSEEADPEFDLSLDDDLDVTGDIEIEGAGEIEFDATPEADDEFQLELSADEAPDKNPDASTPAEGSDQGSDLGGDLGIDFPDETAELERVVAETDDGELLDEIERSLEELEADGLLTPDIDTEAEFTFSEEDADTSATKLDLARAYIDMGDDDGAREILGEVLTEGDSTQQTEANELLNKL
jgi:pilus assembly protein FimV